ncbi:hypothetical protein [Xanthocytophaga agilis]|uniref:Uncharacterized protein n=1 Tax=Xanthocytophaga agilis TaxID=3048010 RepID=A0AAE3RDY8_9BACT|nr:hypothetical protein [Xanthocytophaga agilis]MDJ1506764.1 hypothetical protein [Xanthocytophaga agilis]
MKKIQSHTIYDDNPNPVGAGLAPAQIPTERLGLFRTNVGAHLCVRPVSHRPRLWYSDIVGAIGRSPTFPQTRHGIHPKGLSVKSDPSRMEPRRPPVAPTGVGLIQS